MEYSSVPGDDECAALKTVETSTDFTISTKRP